MDDFLRWMPDSPYRVPEWRWLRAMHLNETGRRIDRRVDDAWVKHARDALRGRGRAGTLAATVRAAREMWNGDPDRRGEVEARLLAGDGDAAVAARTALPEEVIAAYAEVFFCVRPTLKATDWVLSEAVGYSPFIGFFAPLPWASWRLAAVAGGPLFADVVIATFTGRPLPPEFTEFGGADEVRVREFARLWVASMAAVTPAAFAVVLREYRRLRQDDARRRGRKVRVGPMVLAMESLLLSRSVVGIKNKPLATVGHHGREGVSDVHDQVGGTTHPHAGESASSRQHARPSSERPGLSPRRTHAA